MKVLLSIKPRFAELIFEGTKKFEFRKAIFKDASITTVVVYASSPLQQVIGEFEIENIIHDKLDSLWAKTKKKGGIDKDYFDKYFGDRKIGYAIGIKNVKKYDKPLSLKKDFNLSPPQSFLYLDK